MNEIRITMINTNKMRDIYIKAQYKACARKFLSRDNFAMLQLVANAYAARPDIKLVDVAKYFEGIKRGK